MELIRKTVLTGVKPTHQPHLGNFLGAMKPALELANSQQFGRSLLFVADYHALTSVHDPLLLTSSTEEVAASWLACGLDPQRTIIYKQSDIPEVFELSWILSCFTAKGLMNRAHAYKAKIAENQSAGKTDFDFGVNMGLFCYPVLMTADILLFSADLVPVGEDQIQHVEIARDIAQRFNRAYGEVLKVPEFLVQRSSKLIPGLDGRKMSKSYGNHIPLFSESSKLRQLVMKIKTDSSQPSEPKDPQNSILMDLYRAFASEEEVQALTQRYQEGIAWGHVKEELYRVIERRVSPFRVVYLDFLRDRAKLHNILKQGAIQAREIARPLLKEIRKAIGVVEV